MEGFYSNENHRVYEKHFHKSDFETTSVDTRTRAEGTTDDHSFFLRND